MNDQPDPFRARPRGQATNRERPCKRCSSQQHRTSSRNTDRAERSGLHHPNEWRVEGGGEMVYRAEQPALQTTRISLTHHERGKKHGDEPDNRTNHVRTMATNIDQVDSIGISKGAHKDRPTTTQPYAHNLNDTLRRTSRRTASPIHHIAPSLALGGLKVRRGMISFWPCRTCRPTESEHKMSLPNPTASMMRPQPDLGRVLSKVPEVTIWFWIIKVLCTTVGETAADYLNVNRGLGLNKTSVVTGVLLVVALGLQFTAKRYVPWRYWVTVALVSIFGTLVTDLLSQAGVRLEVTTIVFTILLAATFLAWYATDHTLSIHSIFTTRREAFYWTAVLVSFALGTASGDLMSERLGYGYLVAGMIIAGLIVVTALLWRGGMNPILGFWIVYIFTRPLGASIGDYLLQPHSERGLGLGATKTSVIFLTAIVAVVLFLTITKIDTNKAKSEADPVHHGGGLWQTALYVGVLVIGGTVFYNVRTHSLANASTDSAAVAPAANATATTVGSAAGGNVATTLAAAGAPQTKLGNLSNFRVIVQDMLDKLNAGDQTGATKRADDLEREWDKGAARLQPLDGKTWTLIDGKADTVLRQLRASSPNIASEKQALTDMLTVLV
jgi:uncharacterized membrane-anchored protein